MRNDMHLLPVCACFVAILFPVVSCDRGNDYSAEDYLPGHRNNRELYKLGEFNAKCRISRDCRHFGYVCRDNKTCQCDFMYIPDTNKKTCVGGVDQRCIYDEHCIEGAFCMNQSVCKCKESSPFVLEDGLVCSGTHERSHQNNIFICIVLIYPLFLIL